MPANKLYVGNLSYSVTEDKLRELFSKYGQIKEAVVIKDKQTDRSKGFGFVEFETPEEARKAADDLNGTEHEGRSLKV
ncbi:RNA recognition motif domain-containing protein, partial [Elusimicrobiota bacterium]